MVTSFYNLCNAWIKQTKPKTVQTKKKLKWDLKDKQPFCHDLKKVGSTSETTIVVIKEYIRVTSMWHFP